jgi:hypothetical protein
MDMYTSLEYKHHKGVEIGIKFYVEANLENILYSLIEKPPFYNYVYYYILIKKYSWKEQA